MALLPPNLARTVAGSVTFENRDLRHAGRIRDAAIARQSPRDDLPGPMTSLIRTHGPVNQNRRVRAYSHRRKRTDSRKRAAEMLRLVNIPDAKRAP